MIIYTSSKIEFHILNPSINMIKLDDIAHALSYQCRYNGHTKYFYSVAEHSVLIALYLEHMGFQRNVILAGLFHDGAEAYIGDIVSPLKNHLFGIEDIEKKIQQLIFQKFNIYISKEEWGLIKEIDEAIRVSELNDLIFDRIMVPSFPFHFRLQYWEPKKAKKEFLKFYKKWM